MSCVCVCGVEQQVTGAHDSRNFVKFVVEPSDVFHPLHQHVRPSPDPPTGESASADLVCSSTDPDQDGSSVRVARRLVL